MHPYYVNFDETLASRSKQITSAAASAVRATFYVLRFYSTNHHNYELNSSDFKMALGEICEIHYFVFEKLL